jgi:hypothetical protein
MVVGVDCHKDTLAVCGVDALGKPQATGVFPNTARGIDH